MLSCSPALKAEFQKLRGRRLEARVRIDYSDANIDNTVTAFSGDIQPKSRIEQVFNGKEDVSAKWASLDGSWVLGEYALIPETASEAARYEMGWWSNSLSNYAGDFPYTTGRLYGERLYGEYLYGELALRPSIAINFTPRTISSVSISFDNARNEYASSFNVILKNASGTVLYDLAVTGNTGTKYSTTIPQQNLVTSIEIVVNSWSNALRQAKIAEAFTSVFDMYNGDDIISIDVLETREASVAAALGSTASGRCVVSLYNRDRRFDYDNTTSKLYNLIRENVRVTIEIGAGNEWIPLGVFYAKAWDISKQSIVATVTGVDRIAILSESDFTKSQIITPPDPTSVDINSDANWNAGTKTNISVQSGGIEIAYV